LERIPPLTLQPIVENAVKHGIKNKEQDCIIMIKIQKQDGMTLVKVKDNGQGMSRERAEQLGKETLQSESGSGLALYNVNRRLTMMFGEEASLQIASTPGFGTDIQFAIPQTEEKTDGKNDPNFNR
jgi:two-component system sensor histidine kinase LytS